MRDTAPFYTNHSIPVGWSSIDITPTPPCWLSGYSDRTLQAQAIHDPLSAHAIALGNPRQPFVLIICDLIAVDDALTQIIRQRGSATHPGATFWLAATHTHSGPDVVQLQHRQPDQAIIEQIIQGALAAARQAIAAMRPMQARWASAPTQGIVTNRDHPNSGEDGSLDLLYLYATEQDQKPAAILGSFPCHPTVLSAESLLISADLPGAFRRHLQAQLGHDTWIALLTGAAGDMSTRHTRLGQGSAELQRLGRLLADHAYALINQAHPLKLALPDIQTTQVALTQKKQLSPDTLRMYTETITKRLLAEQQAGNTAQARTLQTTLQGLHETQHQTNAAYHTEVAALKAGELALIAIPGELYNSLGVDICQCTERRTLLCGYTNSYIGYLPTSEAYERLDYEVLMSPFAPGTGEDIRNAAVRLLQ